MELGARIIRFLAWAVGAVIAFMGLRSDDPAREIAGAVLFVLLIGWMVVTLFRARRKVVR